MGQWGLYFKPLIHISPRSASPELQQHTGGWLSLCLELQWQEVVGSWDHTEELCEGGWEKMNENMQVLGDTELEFKLGPAKCIQRSLCQSFHGANPSLYPEQSLAENWNG